MTKIYPLIIDLGNSLELKSNEGELNAIRDKIKEKANQVKLKNCKSKIIEILPSFKMHIQKMTKFDTSQTLYAKRISNIIKNERQKFNKAITLKKIQNKYIIEYKEKISLTTISRVLRNHLDLHFKRTKIKNPKLNKINYKFMEFLFLKCIVRAMKLNLGIIFIDETSFYLENNNFRDWIGKKENILKGAEKYLKEKINVIMAINEKGIVHYKLVETNVNADIFTSFINELSLKLTEEQIKKSIIVYDNATCHKTQEVVEKCLDKKFKVITNIPYKSEFNGIEFLFGYFKKEYYKFIFSNKNEQKKKILDIIKSQEITDNICSFYLQTYENYYNTYLKKIEKEDICEIYEKIINKSDDDLSKSFEE